MVKYITKYIMDKRRTDPIFKSKMDLAISLYGRRKSLEYKLKLFSILNQYSCIKCGFSDIRALQFDHIKGKGNQDRINRNKTGSKLIKWYSNHPEEARLELQVLCANCNWIKRVELNETNIKQGNLI